MKTLFAILFFAVSFLVIPTAASACLTFSDCAIGSKCVKRGGNLYGVCKGGFSPGNAHDKHPVYDPLDPDGTFGDTCNFDSNCGVVSKCVKRRGASTGTCFARR